VAPHRGVVVVIRVLVVDDHAVVRQGLMSLLEEGRDMECVGEAGDAGGALALTAELDPDVVLLDLSMPGEDGVSVIRRLRAREDPARILVLSSYGEGPRVLEALDAGADGYLLKRASSEGILDAIRAVATGGGPIDPRVAPSVIAALRDRGQSELLTEREREVLELVRQGHSNKVIARRLRIAEATVKTHVTHILQRVGVADRTQAALWAERHLRANHAQDGSP
jgi:DNA-binding NarL/FixJ family response regulator